MQKFIRVLLASLCLTPFPMTFAQNPDGTWIFGVEYAHADKGRGRGGDDDRGDDRDDDRDDDRGNDRDDDRGNDRDDDRDDDKVERDRDSGISRGSIPDLHLRYPNGWNEQIRNNRYVLTDPKGRKVTNRKATLKDLKRMREAAGR